MSTTTKTLWKIDPTHSEVQFKAKHLVISTVTGSFHSFDGEVETEGDDFENADVSFTVDINSISTNNEDRDTHLKSNDFFNAEAYPKLTFVSTSFKHISGQTYKIKGDLTIRDVTKEVELEAVHGGTAEDPYGNTKAGFEVTGTINRKEFGMKFSAVTEAGNLVVADQVKLSMNVQFVQD